MQTQNPIKQAKLQRSISQGAVRAQSWNSAWHVLPRGKDVCTFLEELPETTNSICKSQRGRHSMEHSGNRKPVNKAGAMWVLGETDKR